MMRMVVMTIKSLQKHQSRGSWRSNSSQCVMDHRGGPDGLMTVAWPTCARRNMIVINGTFYVF